jgi:N-acetylglucosaminyldiphosphoundecaprenol N-acetyl-beta-D-mannosaminyltransferase
MVALDRAVRTAGRNQASAMLGVRIGHGSIGEIIDRSLRAVEGVSPQCVFACANPHSLVEAEKDEAFRRALNDATLVVADGIGISVASTLLNIDVGPRITGFEYFDGLMRAMDSRRSGRVYFFGSTDAVLQKIAARFATNYPGLTLCGTHSPPFRPLTPDENREVIQRIRAARPDVLWVGMTAPKQEKWVHANASALGVPVIGSIGAVFDFFAGTHRRAPDWICHLGLEWVYRLVREPRRMWRRTFVSGPRFLALAVRHHVHKIS